MFQQKEINRSASLSANHLSDTGDAAYKNSSGSTNGFVSPGPKRVFDNNVEQDIESWLRRNIKACSAEEMQTYKKHFMYALVDSYFKAD